MTRVVALYTPRVVERSAIEALSRRVGAEASLSVISWRQSDRPLSDLVREHVVVSSGGTNAPTTVSSAASVQAATAPREKPAPRPPPRRSGARQRLGQIHWSGRRAAVRRARRVRAFAVPRLEALSEAPVTRAARRVVRGGLSRRFSRACRASKAARDLLEGADVVIAMDVASIRTAWQHGRRNDLAAVVYGLDAGLRVLHDRGLSVHQ